MILGDPRGILRILAHYFQVSWAMADDSYSVPELLPHRRHSSSLFRVPRLETLCPRSLGPVHGVQPLHKIRVIHGSISRHHGRHVQIWQRLQGALGYWRESGHVHSTRLKNLIQDPLYNFLHAHTDLEITFLGGHHAQAEQENTEVLDDLGPRQVERVLFWILVLLQELQTQDAGAGNSKVHNCPRQAERKIRQTVPMLGHNHYVVKRNPGRIDKGLFGTMCVLRCGRKALKQKGVQ